MCGMSVIVRVVADLGLGRIDNYGDGQVGYYARESRTAFAFRAVTTRVRDAVRTHNTTHSSRCVWPRASLAPTHVARAKAAFRRLEHRGITRCAYRTHTRPTTAVPRRTTHAAPQRTHNCCGTCTASHAQVHASAAPALHQRSRNCWHGCVNHNRWSGRQRTHEPKRGRSFTHTGHGSTVQMKHMHGVPCACMNLGIGSFRGMLSPVSHPAALPHPPA